MTIDLEVIGQTQHLIYRDFTSTRDRFLYIGSIRTHASSAVGEVFSDVILGSARAPEEYDIIFVEQDDGNLSPMAYSYSALIWTYDSNQAPAFLESLRRLVHEEPNELIPPSETSRGARLRQRQINDEILPEPEASPDPEGAL